MSGRIALDVGDVFANDFKIVAPLSEGGMGMVYVAEQISTGRRRALKLMLPQLVADPKLRARFEQEARIGSKIASEHVIEVVGAGVDTATGVPWLAMELLEGEDLLALVGRVGALPTKAILTIVAQLAHAIGAAHQAKIVHRDLKPENIFVAESMQAGAKYIVKVLDFGIAKLVADAKTMHTQPIGSPGWMAPEQTARAGVIGPQTDVWAIGLIVFYLLTGKNYWRSAEDETATATDILREAMHDVMPRASARAAEIGAGARIPAGFDAWFARSTDRSPNARFSEAREQLDALKPLLDGSLHVPIATVPATAPQPEEERRVLTEIAQRTIHQAPVLAQLAAPNAKANGSRTPLLLASVATLMVVVGAAFYFSNKKAAVQVAAATTSSSAVATAPPIETESASPPLLPLLASSSSATSKTPTPANARAASSLSPNDREAMLSEVRFATASVDAIKDHLDECKRAGGVTGDGLANVVFQPSGAVSDVTVSPPYAGTSEGNCVAAKFRAARVPPYSGKPITIVMTFSL